MARMWMWQRRNSIALSVASMAHGGSAVVMAIALHAADERRTDGRW